MTKTRTKRVVPRVVALAALLTSGCAAGSAGAWQESTSTRSSRYDDETRGAEAGVSWASDGDGHEAVEEIYAITQVSRRAAPEPPSDWDDAPERATTPVDRGDPRIAQATPTPAGERAGGAGTSPSATTSPTASDALAPGRQLLIYTAVLNLAVHHVEDQQNALQAIARTHGGFMARRSGSEMVIRVPAARFEEALAATEALGDVLGRTVDAQDVGEEFRDTHIRLRNLEAMRDRLEELLRRADDVEGALAVEQQLERVTTEIELLRGRLRSLEDRIAYSTITVYFRPRPTTQERVDEFQLPFRWLHRLGLPRLMEVR